MHPVSLPGRWTIARASLRAGVMRQRCGSAAGVCAPVLLLQHGPNSSRGSQALGSAPERHDLLLGESGFRATVIFSHHALTLSPPSASIRANRQGVAVVCCRKPTHEGRACAGGM